MAFLDYLFGTAGSAASDAQRRQGGIDAEYQRQVQQSLAPISGLSSSGMTQDLFNKYLSGLSDFDPTALSVTAPTQVAPDMSAGAIRAQLDPSIAFQQEQARQATEAGAAGRGGLFSGAAGREIAQGAQQIGQQGWGQAANQARQIGLDRNAAQQANFANLLSGNQFNLGLGQQRVGNMGTAFEAAMAPLSATSQAGLDMANTMYGAKTGLSQQQMQGQFANQGLLPSIISGGASIFGKYLGG